MDKQYRMAAVFELPVGQDFDGDIPVGDGFIFVSADVESEKLGSVAHAINIHDAMQDRISELEEERDQLKAQNAGFRKLVEDLCLALIDGCDVVKYPNGLGHKLLAKSPAACLAEHDIQFLTRLKDKCEGDHPHWGRTHIFLGEQIEQLRQKARELS